MVDQPSRSASARRRAAIALARQSQRPGLPDAASLAATYYFGSWVAQEAVDAGLSRVTIGGTTYRYVPKLASATPSAGNVVLLVKVGTQLLVVGVVSGDTTRAPQTNVAP